MSTSTCPRRTPTIAPPSAPDPAAVAVLRGWVGGQAILRALMHACAHTRSSAHHAHAHTRTLSHTQHAASASPERAPCLKLSLPVVHHGRGADDEDGPSHCAGRAGGGGRERAVCVCVGGGGRGGHHTTGGGQARKVGIYQNPAHTQTPINPPTHPTPPTCVVWRVLVCLQACPILGGVHLGGGGHRGARAILLPPPALPQHSSHKGNHLHRLACAVCVGGWVEGGETKGVCGVCSCKAAASPPFRGISSSTPPARTPPSPHPLPLPPRADRPRAWMEGGAALLLLRSPSPMSSASTPPMPWQYCLRSSSSRGGGGRGGGG